MRHIMALGALAASALLAIAAGAQAQGRPQILLFQNDNYRGNEYPVDGAVDRLRFDDRTSSVKVLSGSWELCEDENFRGRCIIVNQDVPKLDRMGFDDKLSSLRPLDRRDRYDNRRYDDRRDDRRR